MAVFYTNPLPTPLLQRRREMRLSVVDRAGFADRARVVRRTRGPRSPRRG
ncbi:hypothetical protein DXO091_017185 [Xanthomonas oryzae pv. oryzae]|nr:hypothetical protein DXO091_012100 [Xanthomonas oryzae pv. oryzae]WJS68604.1 hypothetical protein DXO091_017185 [Xanthomonas oryzae pv. oryzae]